jgi:glyoxalase family protein
MTDVAGLIKGLHHITNVTSNQEVNRRFYTEILGLRRVKLTVNQDDYLHRHLFYADEKGTTGSAITFFEWPQLPQGFPGLSSPHHLSYSLPSLESVPKWKSWLLFNKVPITGPLIRDGRISLYFRDPDGLMMELTFVTSENIKQDYLDELHKHPQEVKEITRAMRLTKFDHASPVTADRSQSVTFFEKVLALKNSESLPNPDQSDGMLIAIGSNEDEDFLRYLALKQARQGFVGKGSVHHIAMAVEDADDQKKLKQRLDEIGIKNSGIIDRLWFKSLYFRDPDGNLLEIATKGPGYAKDESPDSLGSKLVLPPWLEDKRQVIEKSLGEIDMTNKTTWPPKFPEVPKVPEKVRA